LTRTKYRVLGVSLLALGVLIAGFVVYQYYAPSGTDRDNQHSAEDLLHDWGKAAPVPTTAPTSPTTLADGTSEPSVAAGKAFGVIRIPAIKVISPLGQGVGSAVLRKGVGHYLSSALPGQVGNFATAGHVCCRASGQPYKHIGALKTGDLIVVDTASATYTYQVTPMPQCSGLAGPNGHTLVKPDRIDVISANPCTKSQASRKLMTLTTCYPDRSIVDLTNRPAPYRLIVWAELKKVTARS
jgi:sortase A